MIDKLPRYAYIVGVNKRKILLLSDDIRTISGVSLISKQIILNTVDDFDWVQIAAQKQSPDDGSIIDVSESVATLTECASAYVRLYCSSGYGNSDLLRNVILTEKPDAILHITDPHNWTWLYEMEHELRQTIPICYYHVWDNDPAPRYNLSGYLSCDWVACISKLTERCVTEVLTEKSHSPRVSYVPHGVDVDIFKPLPHNEVSEHSTKFLKGTYDYVVLCNNVNIPRKQIPMLIESYKIFCDQLTKKQQDKVTLLLHTNPLNSSGTNLHDVVEVICPDYNILFSTEKVDEVYLNYIYNIADVTINIASTEGFGLATLESLATSTPIIVTDTGGLSEQIVDGHNGIKVTPAVRNLVGAGATPYLYSDICNPVDVAAALDTMYRLSEEERKQMGDNGREFVIKNEYTVTSMCDRIKSGLNTTINNFVQRKRFSCTCLTD